jgi:hypothetical protein
MAVICKKLSATLNIFLIRSWLSNKLDACGRLAGLDGLAPAFIFMLLVRLDFATC